jgi:hypothetical protein
MRPSTSQEGLCFTEVEPYDFLKEVDRMQTTGAVRERDITCPRLKVCNQSLTAEINKGKMGIKGTKTNRLNILSNIISSSQTFPWVQILLDIVCIKNISNCEGQAKINETALT